jgi:hypothetical protein
MREPTHNPPRAVAVPMVDRLFAGGCTALFLVLAGAVVQATWLYWR